MPSAALSGTLQELHAWAAVHFAEVWFSDTPLAEPKDDLARQEAVLVVGVRRGHDEADIRFMPFIRDGEDTIWTAEKELASEFGRDLLAALRDGVAGRRLDLT
jgi:hypothetical protein